MLAMAAMPVFFITVGVAVVIAIVAYLTQDKWLKLVSKKHRAAHHASHSTGHSHPHGHK